MGNSVLRHGLKFPNSNQELTSVVTTLRPIGSASNNTIISERGVRIAINSKVFGNNYQYEYEEREQSTISTKWMGAIKLTSEELPRGIYRIGWFYEHSINDTNFHYKGRVQLNERTIHEINIKPTDRRNYESNSGFYYFESEGIQYIILEYCTEDSHATVYIRRATLEIWRIS